MVDSALSYKDFPVHIFNGHFLRWNESSIPTGKVLKPCAVHSPGVWCSSLIPFSYQRKRWVMEGQKAIVHYSFFSFFICINFFTRASGKFQAHRRFCSNVREILKTVESFIMTSGKFQACRCIFRGNCEILTTSMNSQTRQRNFIDFFFFWSV